MTDHPSRCLIVSDFNPGNLAGHLRNDEEPPAVEPLTGDYAQVIPLLTQPTMPAWREHPEFAVVWTQPEKVIPSFGKLLNHEAVSTAELFAEVDDYTAAIRQAAGRLKAVWVPNWVVDAGRRGLGMADLRPGGVAYALQQLNVRLTEDLAQTTNVFVLNAQRWVNRAGNHAFAPRLWYQAKVPFSNCVFEEAVAEIKAAIRGLQGQAKKLIIVDLDDTLWGGVLGDVGWENLRVGGHDATGEAFADFQRALKAMTRRGVLLAIASKNDEPAALTALQQHPEMQLRKDDFAGWRINWRDKAANILELVGELNLGVQSAVFLDDNPVERARVRDALPEVLVPEWPEDPRLYSIALLSLRCFDAPVISQEDAGRARGYAAERQRSELKRELGSLDGWLGRLNTVMEIARLNGAHLERAAQLLNKTNQMNLSTRRLTAAELKRWVEEEEHHAWAFRVTDNYGDAGLTGLGSFEMKSDTAQVVDFVLSCRVMGRRIEEAMTHWLVHEAKRLGAKQVLAAYLPTAKNMPCLDFWQRSGFAYQEDHVFAWQTASDYPCPTGVQLRIDAE